MATGVIAALTRHGLAVPRDVIVSGFDDALVAFTSVPPLTTARLDTAELTRVCAEILLDSLTTGVAPDPGRSLGIDSGLIIRKSSRSVTGGRDHSARSERCSNAAHITEKLVVRWEADHAPPGLDVPALAAAIADTATTGSDALERATRSMLGAANATEDLRRAQVWCRHAIRTIRAVLAEADACDISASGSNAVNDQLAIFDRALRPLENQTLTENRARRVLHERLLMNIASCSDSQSLWHTLRSGLLSIGMKNAWVAVDDDDRDDTCDDAMRLVFSLDDDSVSFGERFTRADVLPVARASALESNMHVLVPLRAGSTDIGYLVTEPSADHLMELEAIASGIAQVLRHVHQVADLEERAVQLRHANAELDRLARRDSLTGLPNRKMFFETLSDELAARTGDDEVAVLLFDLDGFKSINDSLGHDAGDGLLRVITRRVRDVLSPGDTFARLGGDEFTIVMHQPAGSNRARRLADNLLAVIAPPCILPAGTARVTASVGIAVAPGDGSATRELVRCADVAMYASKASGKNQTTSFAAG